MNNNGVGVALLRLVDATLDIINEYGIDGALNLEHINSRTGRPYLTRK